MTWDRPETVAGFASSPPNPVLMAWVARFSLGRRLSILDIGCGAGRNALPLAALGHRVTGIDRSQPMLEAARARARSEGLSERMRFLEGSMEKLEVPAASFDLIIAQGIWNLATTDLQLVAAVAQAAQAARPGAGLFVFTFSRNTLGVAVAPLPTQRQVYTRFSGSPQVFLTEEELVSLLAQAGFDRSESGPLTEYNRTATVAPDGAASRPVIWEGTWLRRSSAAGES